MELDYRWAVVGAQSCDGISGELAAKQARSPASFKAELLDCLIWTGLRWRRDGELRDEITNEISQFHEEILKITNNRSPV